MNSDYKSSLPVRSEADGLDERVHSKLVDFADPGGANKQMEVSEKLAHIRAFGADPAGVKRQLLLSQEGFANGNGKYDATLNTRPASAGILIHTRAAAPGQSDQILRPTGVQGSVLNTVWALDVAIHDESGNPFNDTNPMPVTVVDSEGTEVNDYNESAVDVIKDASDTHVYTAGAAFKFTQFTVASSGRAKFLIEVDPTNSGTYSKKFTVFVSTSTLAFDKQLKEPIAISSGGKVRVTRTNLDNQPLALYSTISGHTVT